MNLTNYHCHTFYCDGRADMHSFIRFALSEGFSSFGFSSHAPLPFPTNWTMEWDRMDDYQAEFNRLKNQYASQIELVIGLEIDYINEEYNPAHARMQHLPLDYRIGSVHLLPDLHNNLVDIDCPALRFRSIVDSSFQGDLDYVIRLYYKSLLRMIARGGFDILGHADKIHFNASCYRPGLLDEPWYDTLVKDYFEEISRHHLIVEINTKAYLDSHTFFPDERYFPFLHSLGIRVQVNSDAHYPERINYGRMEALQALKNAGYKSVTEWHHGGWEEKEIDTTEH